MITVFSMTVIPLIVFMVFRKWNNKYQEEIFREKMFELRDRLRMLAIEKKVNKRSKEFDYIDFSISKNIEESYFLTMFYIISIENRYKTSELDAYKETFDKIHANINNNEYLRDIFKEKNRITKEYVLGQIPVLVFIIKKSARLISQMAKLKALIKKRLSEINYFPELSAIKSI